MIAILVTCAICFLFSCGLTYAAHRIMYPPLPEADLTNVFPLHSRVLTPPSGRGGSVPCDERISITVDGHHWRSIPVASVSLPGVEPQPEPEIITLDLRDLDTDTRTQRIDDAVHEYVMHEDRHKECDGEMLDYAQRWQCHLCGFSGDYTHMDDWYGHRQMPPHYSTSWDAAWLVYQEMRKHGENGVFEAALMAYYTEYDYHNDEMYPAQQFFDIIDAWTPERLCIAALKSCNVEVKDSGR